MLRGSGSRIGSLLLLCGLAAAPAGAQSTTAANAATARALLQAFIVTRLGATGETVEKFNERRDRLVNAIGDGLAIGIATAPVGGSSAGFTYVVDPATGERTLKSDSFGPLFLDRPLTAGKGVFNLGFNFTRSSFDKFQGDDLRDQGLLLFDNRVRYTRDGYEQFIQEYMTLEPDVSVFTVYGTYGITDRIDIGVVVPFANVSLKGTRYWDYDVAKTFVVDPADRAFYTPGPRSTNFVQDRGDVSASGIGDVTIRGKVALGPQKGEGVAVTGALRLPTGSEDDLLGTGKAAGQLKVVASKALGDRASLYGNGGYSFGGLSDEVGYGVGMDAVLLPQKSLTVSFELLGQNLRDSVNGVGSDALGPVSVTDLRFTPPEAAIFSANRLFFPAGSANILRGAVGAKYRLGGSALLAGGVLFPLNSSEGLHTTVTPFVGLDVTFSGR